MSSKKYCNAICLKKDGSVEVFKIDSKISLEDFNISDIDAKYNKSIGYGNLDRECDFEYLET